MFYYKEELINIIKPDKPDPAAAKVLQEILWALWRNAYNDAILLPKLKF